jgi:hypothetical protein
LRDGTVGVETTEDGLDLSPGGLIDIAGVLDASGWANGGVSGFLVSAGGLGAGVGVA